MSERTADTPPDRRSDAPRPVRPRSTNALVVLVLGLAGVLLYVAHSVFIPITLAILFALLLSAPVEALNRKGVPRSLSALVILLLFVLIVGGILDALVGPAQAWLSGAPRTMVTIQQKIGPLSRLVRKIDAATNRAGHLTEAPGARPAGAQQPITPASAGWMAETSTDVISAMTVIILTLFLLAAGPPTLARMSAAFASDERAMHVLRMIEAVRAELGRYYATITLINIGLGLATFALTWALGMPNPVLWGALAGALNFIPYIGSTSTLIILGIVALVSFDGIARVFAVMGGYLALAALEGQVVQPLLVGQRLDLNPIIVFLSLWLGGWFWGIAGFVLAIPSLVALKVIAEHEPGGAPMVEFLSPGKSTRLRPLMTLARRRTNARPN